MYDYLKIWIYDMDQIKMVLDNSYIKKEFTSNEGGVLTGITGRFKNWNIKTLSPVCLQITGSIHKYYNGGTNENDFAFKDAVVAILDFCEEFKLNPKLAFIKNLEFGVNLQLTLNASEIIDQIICYNCLQPIRHYNKIPNCFFIEFELEEYYLKIYDKGKQYKTLLPETPNTLRIEIKAMKNRLLPNITTLADLLEPQNLQVLGVKLATILKGLVFDDDTIDLKNLTSKDRKIYRELNNPHKWKGFRGHVNSTIRKQINRFKLIVETNGKRKIQSTLERSINEKLQHLSCITKFPLFTPNTYTVKTDSLRYCESCGKDITPQQKDSRFCSAKYVGEKRAKQCRNLNSNPRNSLLRKIKKINSKGVLFDIGPYVINRSNPEKYKSA